MVLIDGLHANARKRFDGQGAALLKLVVTFAEPPGQQGGFTPNVYKHGTFTDDDIVGDLHIEYVDHKGEPSGIVVAKPGGDRTGLIGEGYKQLQLLSRAMAKVKPFSATASVDFLEAALFEWVKSCAGADATVACVDFVLSALERAAAEHRVIVPRSELYVQSTLTFGPVTISTFPESFFEQFEAKPIADGESRAEHEAWCRSLRADFQGLAIADTSVFAEPIRARQVAVERIELVVGILRFFAPAHIDPNTVSRVARWGHAPERTETVFTADATGRCTAVDLMLIDQPGKLVIDDEMTRVLGNVGLEKLRDIVARDKRTDLEQALLNGIVTFGRAALTADLRERMVWYCAGLESSLLKNSSEPIQQNLAERLAIIAHDNVADRLTAAEHIRDAYSRRSDLVHHAMDIEDREVVAQFARHGRPLFLRIVNNVHRFASKEQLLNHIDEMKPSCKPLTPFAGFIERA